MHAGADAFHLPVLARIDLLAIHRFAGRCGQCGRTVAFQPACAPVAARTKVPTSSCRGFFHQSAFMVWLLFS